MSKSREQLVKYLSEIDITDKVVLDAGCGPKDKWARNFTKGKPKDYLLLDSNEKFEPDIFQDLNLEITDFGVNKFGMFFINFENKDIWQGDFFDTILCLETIEHLWNPLAAIKLFYRILKEGGKAYFSSPFINPYHDEVDYARYTSEWYQKVLTEVGFKDIKIKPRIATLGYQSLIEFYILEGLRMSKTRLKKGQQGKMAEIGYFCEASK